MMRDAKRSFFIRQMLCTNICKYMTNNISYPKLCYVFTRPKQPQDFPNVDDNVLDNKIIPIWSVIRLDFIFGVYGKGY